MALFAKRPTYIETQLGMIGKIDKFIERENAKPDPNHDFLSYLGDQKRTHLDRIDDYNRMGEQAKARASDGRVVAPEVRSVRIIFANLHDASKVRVPAFYVGDVADISAVMPNVQREDALRNGSSSQPGSPVAENDFSRVLAERIAVRDKGTIDALNRISVAGLTYGTVTIVGDAHPFLDHAHVIGEKIAEATRIMGHTVSLPQFEAKQDKKIASKSAQAEVELAR